jgi:hypothetical protein
MATSSLGERPMDNTSAQSFALRMPRRRTSEGNDRCLNAGKTDGCTKCRRKAELISFWEYLLSTGCVSLGALAHKKDPPRPVTLYLGRTKGLSLRLLLGAILNT